MTAKIVFMGTAAFSVPALRMLAARTDVTVSLVISQPSRAAGRGKQPTPPPVAAAALELGLRLEQPESLKSDEVHALLAAEEADLFVVAAYGQILRQRTLDLPRLGCLNIHGSLLPRWRGAAPISWSIAAGDATTRGALRWSRDLGQQYGDTWLDAADTEIRRDKTRVIERIFITGDNPLLSSVALSPAFYRRFEPLLGDGFHVIIPDRTTIALYPRLGRPIPAAEAASLFQTWLLASHPVSREIFRATPDGLVADGLLTEESDPQKIPLP